MADGYMKIINGLLAESKARSEIAAEDRMREAKAAGRLRESGSGDGLFDLGPGVPKPYVVRRSSEELLREAALDEQALRESESGAGLQTQRESAAPHTPLVDLGEDVPKPSAKLASYGGGARPEVAYEDRSTYPLACDLFTVLPQNDETGSPNLENNQCEQILQTLTQGRPLSDFQIGLLKELVDRHKAEIDALRASPDYSAKDVTNLPDPATARLVESARGEQVGLQPSSQQPDGSPGQHPCSKAGCNKGLLADGSVCSTCRGTGIAPGKAQPLAESGPLRGLLAPDPLPDEGTISPDGLFDLGPGVPRPIPRFMQVGPAAEQTPAVSRMRSSAGEGLTPMRENALAEAHLLGRYNKEVANGKPRRLREARGIRTPRDPENLTMGEVRELMQEWEAVAA